MGILELKNIICKVKNAMDGLNGRMEGIEDKSVNLKIEQ